MHSIVAYDSIKEVRLIITVRPSLLRALAGRVSRDQNRRKRDQVLKSGTGFVLSTIATINKAKLTVPYQCTSSYVLEQKRRK